jgi:hypothetical protein
LKQGKNEASFKSAKKSVVLLEPLIFSQIKSLPEIHLKDNRGFIERLCVLLIAYYNIGVA